MIRSRESKAMSLLITNQLSIINIVNFNSICTDSADRIST